MSDRREIYRSPNGDSWFLGREPQNGHAFIIHQPNAPRRKSKQVFARFAGSRDPSRQLAGSGPPGAARRQRQREVGFEDCISGGGSPGPGLLPRRKAQRGHGGRLQSRGRLL
jgi:hypothetical protein